MATYSGSDKRIKYLFENGGGGGSSTLAGLSDVDLTSVTNEDFLQYDSTNQKWQNVAISGVSIQPLIYSLTEREIGVWTDGKPLYQKTLSLISSSDASETIIYTGDSTIEIKNFDGYIVYSSGNIVEHLPLNISTAIWTMVGDTVNKLVQKISQLDYCGLTEYVTIQYTKTTDTAGSGTWTPSGAPAVHYSTNEQVVGTWVDGKTLYEKTIMLGTRITINYDYTTILADMSSDNIESLIDAVVFDNNGGTDYNLVRLVVGCVDIMLGGDKKLYANIMAGALERKMTGYTIRYTKTSS